MRYGIILVMFLALLLGIFVGEYLLLALPTSTCSFPAVAVSSTGSGSIARIDVRVEPGEGRVYVSVTPKVGEDTQQSAELAAEWAKRMAGIFTPVDFYFTITAPSAIVEGPSAGAAMTVAAYCALTGRKPRQDAVVTGTIEPDGTIGPVGGLLQKLEAAARAGYKYFLVPKGQLIVRTIKRERRVYHVGPMRIVEYVPVVEEINLQEVGEQLGIHVLEVSDVRQLLSFFFSDEGSQ